MIIYYSNITQPSITLQVIAVAIPTNYTEQRATEITDDSSNMVSSTEVTAYQYQHGSGEKNGTRKGEQ